jgi:hypothetical protein
LHVSFLQATRRGVTGILGAWVLLAALPAAADDERATERCLKNALERWFCAADPEGVAVIDGLGSVVCAKGQCVEADDEWHCSPASGGKAELTPEGPVCEGGCRSPRAADCERM